MEVVASEQMVVEGRSEQWCVSGWVVESYFYLQKDQFKFAAMEKVVKNSTNIIFKKDFFIKSRKEDIRLVYEFSPKIIGRGAYGIVYKARHKQPPHTYRVVKLIAKKLVKNPETLQNQVQIMRKLDHPMVVRLYQSFQDEKNIYLVEDFCEGGELFERLEKNGQFDENSARQIFVQIIKCLKYMHSQRVAHRDIKPENFLMSSKKTLELKLIDFGLSYEWKEDMRKELLAEGKNKIIGTSYYIAPEVLKLDYDQRCDIWSAGVILYILVTGCPPFDGQDDKSIMDSVKKMQYTFDIPQAKSLSAQIKDLISKILVAAEKRLTLDQILSHPWMTKVLSQQPLNLDIKKMKNFASFSKLKKLAVSYIATQLPQKQIHYLGELFQQIDVNGDGFLTIDQLFGVLQKQHETTNNTAFKQIFEEIDTDGNGKINYNEFVASCLEASQIQNEEYLEYIFKNIDVDKNGKISAAEIKQILEEKDLSKESEARINGIIRKCDKNEDGEIDYNEFINELGIRK